MKRLSPIIVSQAEDGQRLDKWLKSHFSSMSKVMIEKLCRKGQLRINSARVRPNTRVLENQKIRVPDFVRNNDPQVYIQQTNPNNDLSYSSSLNTSLNIYGYNLVKIDDAFTPEFITPPPE